MKNLALQYEVETAEAAQFEKDCLTIKNVVENYSIYNQNNFYTQTKANFLKIENFEEIIAKEPDYISYSGRKMWADFDDFDCAVHDDDGDVVEFLKMSDGYCSTYTVLQRGWENTYLVQEVVESSRYWYTKKGVYRLSSHWGQCASCSWLLNNEEISEEENFMGFCSWNNFQKNQE
jgi:hypothetical protein